MRLRGLAVTLELFKVFQFRVQEEAVLTIIVWTTLRASHTHARAEVISHGFAWPRLALLMMHLL